MLATPFYVGYKPASQVAVMVEFEVLGGGVNSSAATCIVVTTHLKGERGVLLRSVRAAMRSNPSCPATALLEYSAVLVRLLRAQKTDVRLPPPGLERSETRL